MKTQIARPPRAGLGEAWRFFARTQLFRARFRLIVFVAAAIPAVFWTGALILYASANGLAQTLLGIALIVWGVLTLPFAVLHGRLIVAAAGYILTRHVRWFMWVTHLRGEAAAAHPDAATDEPQRPLMDKIVAVHVLAGYTSPLSGLALWSYGVLVRAPHEVYAAEKRRSRAMPKEIRIVSRVLRHAPTAAAVERRYWEDLSRHTSQELVNA